MRVFNTGLPITKVPRRRAGEHRHFEWARTSKCTWPQYFLSYLSELVKVHVLCRAKLKNDCEPEDLKGSDPYMFQGVISEFS
jgi:hypothetical protein